MTILDIGVDIILIYTTFSGFRRGAVRIVVDMLSLCLGIFFAYHFYPLIGGWISLHVSQLASYASVIGFFSIWLTVFALLTLIGAFLGSVMEVASLGLLNRLIGAAIGLVKGAVIVMVILWPMMHFKWPLFERSKVAKTMTPLLGLWDRAKL